MESDNARSRDYRALWDTLIYIQRNLESALSLDVLAEIAHYSPYHFHRLFKQFTGETVKAYVRRLRLEQSAFALQVSEQPVTDLAFQSGYFTHESFTRAFRHRFGLNPSEYRAARTLPDRCNDEHITSVEEVYFSGRTCLCRRYDGPYEATPSPEQGDSPWKALMRQLDAPPGDWDRFEWFGISRDDPEITAPSHVRYDACVAVPEDTKPDPTLRRMKLDGGVMIRASYSGPFYQLTEAYHYVLRVWAADHTMPLAVTRAPFEKFIIEGGEWVGTEIYFPIENR